MLTRSITLLHATALVVGIIIGASIFVQPSAIAGAVPTLGAVYAERAQILGGNAQRVYGLKQR